ncbi:MAG: hypothetical protein IPM51_10565 [Sphingobacteriaceae bacterium]|nr:hypothetical protein [Sphingobacteriaceae bacterium]
MEYIKNIFAFLFLALLISLGLHWIESNFIAEFLKSNLIIILLTLLAINTATVSILLSKLKEISEKHKDFNFEESYGSLKSSLTEQIVLICFGFIVLILADSKIIQAKLPYQEIIFNTLNTAIFIYSVDILRDTGKAIFIIVDFEKKK